MPLALGPIGQIACAVADVDRADAFYGGVLGLRKLFRFGDLALFDCAGARRGLRRQAGSHREDGRP